MIHQTGLLALSAALLASAAQAEGLTSDEFQEIAAATFAPMIEEHAIPGIAIGLTLGGEQHFFTQGLASREDAIPVTTATVFELGSLSKLFNVALAALAEQKGALSLNSLVAQELPLLAGSAFDRITLGDLAAHATGGLPLQVPDEINDEVALMRYLAEWSPETDTKRTRSYSNVSIGLLGLVTGERLGGSFESAAETRLFPLLGLESTFIDVPKAEMGRYAFGYAKADDSPVRVNPGMLDAEAYGIKSTVADMTRFLDAHLGNIDLAPEMSAALARTRAAEFDTAHYAQAMIWEGYPWPVSADQLAAGNSGEMALKPQPMTPRKGPEQLDDATFFNKTGATNGFGAYVAMIPAENIGVVVLANRNYPNPARAEATLRLINDVIEAARD